MEGGTESGQVSPAWIDWSWDGLMQNLDSYLSRSCPEIKRIGGGKGPEGCGEKGSQVGTVDTRQAEKAKLKHGGDEQVNEGMG